MAIYFLDSSAVVKRYVPETGSAWVKAITDSAAGNLLYVARITGAEVISAVTRRQRRGQITVPDAAVALTAFRRDFPPAFLVIEVAASVVARAMDLAECHGLRGYDAVHLAAALELRDQCRLAGLPEPVFVAADNQLNAAALAEGLAVDDPNNH
ncbi:MAG: type II toxin-antitoxin system VapC family toxin [Armatimonadota bacterium]|nr:type II toxin-antitoxin system VapC family toxin [Armatimonadota bacterium]